MTQQDMEEQESQTAGRRGRGPTRPFPVNPLADALKLARSILRDGVDGKIVRLTLSRMLDESREYKLTQALITSSSKYGLTKGSFVARELTVTDQGREAISSLDSPSRQSAQHLFDIGIASVGPFEKLYQKLKEKALPDESVLSDELVSLGVMASDGSRAAAVFAANLKFLNLIVETGGRERVSSVESLPNQVDQFGEGDSTSLEETDIDEGIAPSTNGMSEAASVPTPVASSPVSQQPAQVGPASSEPTVHIDIQIHIDSSATAELIDNMFASMAKHIYGREG